MLGRPCIWLIGGTQDSAQLARAIAQEAWPCTVTVTTETARSLYPICDRVHVWVGKLSLETVPAFLQEHQIGMILDASHPYAVEISKLAIAIAAQFKIPYLRYERPSLPAWEGAANPSLNFPDVETLLASPCLLEQRVLLTVGYRFLPKFRPWHDRATLFTRILPSPVALNAALEAGFVPERILAMRPPVPADLERALWQHWQITMVVTKASGSPGGEDIKRQLAAELGITLVAIARPAVPYPQQTSALESALAFCRDHRNRLLI